MKHANLDNLRHSAAHLLAAAVLELYPKAKPTIGPFIEDGFYYDFEFPAPISETDLPKIEKRMKQLVMQWNSFERQEMKPDEARKHFSANPYKLELIDDIKKENEKITFYTSGKFTDLCRGGHLNNPAKELKHFKLLSVAGAYWRGNEKNTMLTRIYGTAFDSKETLEQHIAALENAKLRDHRKIGKEMELFTFADDVGKGLPLWLPNGTIMKDEIEKLAHEYEGAAQYDRVSTPHLAKEELFVKSGHLPYYKDSMYPGMKMDDGSYYLKAMNCPLHHIIYNHKPRSYRELPIRLAEYGTVYRNELSGTLAGLLRVRMLSMNDAHIYCREDQIETELTNIIALTQKYLNLFDLKNYWFRLSLWDPKHTDKYYNEPKNWKISENIIRKLLKKLNVKFEEAKDEAAFYGPKIDVQFKSAAGREETISTIQLDFGAKTRFNLQYVNEKGKEVDDIFVIHRAPLSTHERFIALLIEHFAGNCPTWPSPIQVSLLSVSQDHSDYVIQLANEFNANGIRAQADISNETVGNKIRKASMQKVPYLLVIGEKEMKSINLSIRARGADELIIIAKEKFMQQLQREIAQRTNTP